MQGGGKALRYQRQARRVSCHAPGTPDVAPRQPRNQPRALGVHALTPKRLHHERLCQRREHDLLAARANGVGKVRRSGRQQDDHRDDRDRAANGDREAETEDTQNERLQCCRPFRLTLDPAFEPRDGR